MSELSAAGSSRKCSLKEEECPVPPHTHLMEMRIADTAVAYCVQILLSIKWSRCLNASRQIITKRGEDGDHVELL